MPHARLRVAALCLLAALGVLAGAGGGAGAALVAIDNVILRADGGFEPRKLPRRGYAPIHFRGFVDIASKDGTRPSPLRRAVIDFDRDGRLGVAGLPRCPAERVATATPAEARAACRGAIVGSGRVKAQIALAGGVVPASSPLTIFNGPRVGGNPSVVLHARTTVPGTQTYAITAPILRRKGRFRHRVVLELPPIAAGLGALTRIEVKVGRRYRAGGKRRSYVSARCSDGVLETHGRFELEDGMIIDGSVEKACSRR